MLRNHTYANPLSRRSLAVTRKSNSQIHKEGSATNAYLSSVSSVETACLTELCRGNPSLRGLFRSQLLTEAQCCDRHQTCTTCTATKIETSDLTYSVQVKFFINYFAFVHSKFCSGLRFVELSAGRNAMEYFLNELFFYQ